MKHFTGELENCLQYKSIYSKEPHCLSPPFFFFPFFFFVPMVLPLLVLGLQPCVYFTFKLRHTYQRHLHCTVLGKTKMLLISPSTPHPFFTFYHHLEMLDSSSVYLAKSCQNAMATQFEHVTMSHLKKQANCKHWQNISSVHLIPATRPPKKKKNSSSWWIRWVSFNIPSFYLWKVNIYLINVF